MLPFVGVLVFALMGIAALVVDAGIAFSTQAQLESTGRTLALEHARFVAANPTLDPNEADEAWKARVRQIESDLLGQQAQPTDWIEDPEDPTRWQYGRGVAARFATAAMVPVTIDENGQSDALSVRDLLAARAAGVPESTLSGGGLRTQGFQPQVSLPAQGTRPAVRVGRAVAGLPGLASIALAEDEVTFPVPMELAAEVNDRGELLLLEDDTTCVGWRIDPSGPETRRSGGVVVPDVPAADDPPGDRLWALDDTRAYVPVLRGGCSDDPGEIVGFLNLRSLPTGEVGLSTEPLTRPNASARPAPGRPAPTNTSWGCSRPGVLCVPSYVEAPPT